MPKQNGDNQCKFFAHFFLKPHEYSIEKKEINKIDGILFQFEADHNQNYITKCAVHSDEDEHAHPSYSDVISNNAPGEGLYIFLLWNAYIHNFV